MDTVEYLTLASMIFGARAIPTFPSFLIAVVFGTSAILQKFL